MRIAATIALNRFPFWKRVVESALQYADALYCRFDALNGDPDILRGIKGLAGDKVKGVFVADEGWTVPQWREDMIRMLDADGCDIVLTPDEDEEFGDGFADELKRFADSDKDAMMFYYEPLRTREGKLLNEGMPYPPDPHMKAYKWRKGLTYFPYHGDGKVALYANPAKHWNATTKIQHLCCWTDAMHAQKRWRSNTPFSRGNRPVTLLGFGPTAEHGAEMRGEVWSLNNCYESFGVDTLKRVTRVFEMHQFDTRENYPSGDGKPHYWHLDQMGQRGHRIVMQRPHPNIANSEAYPIQNVQAMVSGECAPLAYDFEGTVPYMVAMAIMEGYTEIRTYGFDQGARKWTDQDKAHIPQRECFGRWLAYAAGRGIKITGVQSMWMQGADFGGRRLYGYDYGPDVDEFWLRKIWAGHSCVVLDKGQDRAMLGMMMGEKA